jgi:Xaa-Pro aminopeptidase
MSFEQKARLLCPHHVGHYLGMDVHDTGNISRSIKMEPGMIVTVEPGRNVDRTLCRGADYHSPTRQMRVEFSIGEEKYKPTCQPGECLEKPIHTPDFA